jgi:hypothetical protein
MSIFRRPDYQSDTTLFIEQLKAARPGLEQAQRQGRALLWDKNVDRHFEAEAQTARVPQQPYVYQTGSGLK